MKKVASCIAVFLVLMGTSGAVSAQKLLISISEGVDADFQMKVITEAYWRIGITVEFRWFPSERAIFMANSGVVDGEFLRKTGIKRNYPNLIRIPVALKTDDVVVVTKDKKFKVEGWKSLLPYRVGYVRGLKMVENNLADGTQTEAVGTMEQAYGKLAAGRTDVVIDGREQAYRHFRTLGLNDLVVLEPPLLTIQLFHYLHVKNRHLVQPLTASLQQMEREGLIQPVSR